MNGVHDMGGMDGFGKVEPEPNEPMFHTEWEARVLAMVRAMGAAGAFNIDTSRFYREALPPACLSRQFLLQEMAARARGPAGRQRLHRARTRSPPAMRLQPAKPLKRGKFTLDDVERVMVRGKFGRPAPAPAKFKAGDRVRAKNIHPATHTRLPRYVRGHVGVIEREHGCHVFPDTAAMEAGENPQWLYTVVFDGARALGRRMPIRRSRYPSMRSSPIWSRHDGHAAARATSAIPEHSPRRRRPGVSRALGGAGLCDGADAA